jgi:hypothetical protein
MSLSRTSLAVVLVLAASGPAAAQDWNWSKVVPAGRAIEIKGVNGDIEAGVASGNQVQVVARKSAKRSDPADVRIEVVEHAGGVTICAVYPTPRGERENECLPGARGRSSTRNNDVEVDFEVRVPRGVLFTGRTVNGDVEVTGLTADARVSTVNGSVEVETTGLVDASTVNGSIKARMGRANWTDRKSFSTVNGGITVELPDDLHADVSASTVNGSLSSDWPMTVSGKWGPRSMRGKIGRGGRELALETVNGDIELRRAH